MLKTIFLSFSLSVGASGNHVSVHMYPGYSEDFAGADLTKLDTWVFDSVQARCVKTLNSSIVFCVFMVCSAFCDNRVVTSLLICL